MAAAGQVLRQERTRRTTIIFRSSIDHCPGEQRMPFQAGTRPSDTPGLCGRAAAWCAQDRETNVEIARRLGIGRRTPALWKHRLEFRTALAALQERQASAANRLESDATER